MSSQYLTNYLDSQLGLPSNAVRLSPYNPEWPALYEEAKVGISDLLTAVKHCIEHIGSTAVPGLRAKPVLDIMVGVLSTPDMFAVESLLATAGYEAKGEKGVPGRLFLTYGDPCVYHVHVTELHGAFWVEHILFRDQLRAQTQIAEDYVAIKAQLAQLFPDDRDSYTRGKADFIEDVLANARRSN